MATVCANCGTAQGPFVRDPNFPSLPICGFRPGARVSPEERRARVSACDARRNQRDEGGSGKAAA